MSYRCIDGFVFGERVYPGGCLVEDGDSILGSHAGHFKQVEIPASARTVETASAAPAEIRVPAVAPEAPSEPPAEPVRRGRRKKIPEPQPTPMEGDSDA